MKIKPFTEDELDIIRERSQRKVPVSKIAMELNRPARSINRVRTRLGLSGEKSPLYTPAEVERIKALRADGMISTWVAEEIGRGRETIARKYPMPPGCKEEWSRTWQAIRRSPEMLALHHEFSPRFNAPRD